MTGVCVTLTESTCAAVVDRMVDLHEQADLFEVRADALADPDLLTLLRARRRPLVFTCRPKKQGGRLDLEPARRRQLLMEAARRGFEYVDVEGDSGFTDVMVEKAGRGLIVSHHDFEGTPEDLGALFRRLAGLGADVVKIAVTPRSIADVGRLLACARAVNAAGGPPLLPVAMGPLGLPSRLLAGRLGAPFTYAAPEAGAEAAPGQLSVAELHETYAVRRAGPATRAYGVLGTDVQRSLSPAAHNAAFAARGLDAIYLPLQAEALAPFLEALPDLELSGFAVTRPFKSAIVERLDALDEAAALAGSVNTVVVRAGQLSGSSTDGLGVLVPLRRRIDPKGREVLILGAGGAARAAAFALSHRGASVTVLARRSEQASAVAQAADCAWGTFDSLGQRAWDVLVNATPVGSWPAVAESPVEARLLRPGRVVFDMVYTPLETRLLREAAAAGCTVIDGLEMLVAQAAAQFETWTGLEAPVEAMREGALRELARRGRAA